MSASRVLIVDDNPMNIELAAFVLGAAGFAVESATDAGCAVQRVAEFGPHLVLMDIQMPGMDGLRLTRMLKNDPAAGHIVVVAFTAYAMRGDEAMMRSAGCDGYIAKPIDAASFAATVGSYIPTARGTTAAAAKTGR